MALKLVLLIILSFLAGCVFVGLLVMIAFENGDRKKRIVGGDFLIRKSDEAIDGQIRFTKDIWKLADQDEIIFKVRNIPGEPGDWKEQ